MAPRRTLTWKAVALASAVVALAGLQALVLAADPRASGTLSKKPEEAGAVARALDRATKELPGVSWRTGQAALGDFDFDGTRDVALLGVEGHDAVVAVVTGPVGASSKVLVLRVPELQVRDGNGLCGKATEARLSTEQLGLAEEDEGKPVSGPLADYVAKARAAGGQALRLDDAGDCDAYHVFFSGTRLVWWRH